MPAGQTDKYTPEQTALRLAAATYQGTPVFKYFQHIPTGHPLAILEKQGGTIFRYEFTDEYKALKAARPKDHRLYDWLPGDAQGVAGGKANLEEEEIPEIVDLIEPGWWPYGDASAYWDYLDPYPDWGGILNYPFDSGAYWCFTAHWRDEWGTHYSQMYENSEWVDEWFKWDNEDYSYLNCCKLQYYWYDHYIPPEAYGVAGAYLFTNFYCHKYANDHSNMFPAGFFAGYSVDDVVYYPAMSTVHPRQ